MRTLLPLGQYHQESNKLTLKPGAYSITSKAGNYSDDMIFLGEIKNDYIGLGLIVTSSEVTFSSWGEAPLLLDSTHGPLFQVLQPGRTYSVKPITPTNIYLPCQDLSGKKTLAILRLDAFDPQNTQLTLQI